MGTLRSRGLSLLESIVGFFLLTIIMLGVLRLVDYGLHYSSQAQQKVMAVRVAQRTLNEIRIWSREPNGPGLNFDDWTAWNGYDQPDTMDPGYRVRVTVSDQVLQSPSSEMELAYPAAQRRVLSSSCKMVEILVSWSRDSKEFRLTSYVAEPARPLPATISVTATSGPGGIGPDGTKDFQATALDANGIEIKDVFFEFLVKPGTANGTLTPARTGKTTVFTNVINIPNRAPVYTVGDVVIEASTVYHGRETKGESTPFALTP